MPLGWERINAKKSSPNNKIVFIKPRPGPDESISKDFLERIAAQCVPIMNKHHLAVVSLEEYEPNLEFWGRNFNNGEVIQLVLKSPSTGRWLPFRFVQMVMMHELAHCKHMNHSQTFWAARNTYAADMKALWAKNYTGEGLWGRGFLLENGAFVRQELEKGEILPAHMCGGTFKTRSRKRKVKPKITHREREQRRIEKNFGTGGIILGADQQLKAALEKGKRLSSKPRIAGSQRGRDLRAAAALTRLKVEEESQVKDEKLTAEDKTGDDIEYCSSTESEPDDAVDINGKRLFDRKGRRMIKVCDFDKNDAEAKDELFELCNVSKICRPQNSPRQDAVSNKPHLADTVTLSDHSEVAVLHKTFDVKDAPTIYPVTGKKQTIQPVLLAGRHATCPICSVFHDDTSFTCSVCSHVLRPDLVPNSWSCKSVVCRAGLYVNAGDVAFCGVCGRTNRSGSQ